MRCGDLIQRFGSALNLNVHFHIFVARRRVRRERRAPRRKPRLPPRPCPCPTSAQLTRLANTIAHRVYRHLSRRGWLEGEDESVFLSDSAGIRADGRPEAVRPAPRTRSASRSRRDPGGGQRPQYAALPPAQIVPQVG